MPKLMSDPLVRVRELLKREAELEGELATIREELQKLVVTESSNAPTVISQPTVPVRVMGTMPRPTSGFELDGFMLHHTAALCVLRWYGRPLHCKTELTAEIVRLNLVRTRGRTLCASIRTVIGRKDGGRHAHLFKFYGDGIYGLSEWTVAR